MSSFRPLNRSSSSLPQVWERTTSDRYSRDHLAPLNALSRWAEPPRPKQAGRAAVRYVDGSDGTSMVETIVRPAPSAQASPRFDIKSAVSPLDDPLYRSMARLGPNRRPRAFGASMARLPDVSAAPPLDNSKAWRVQGGPGWTGYQFTPSRNRNAFASPTKPLRPLNHDSRLSPVVVDECSWGAKVRF